MRVLCPSWILIVVFAVGGLVRAEEKNIAITPPMARGQSLSTFSGRPVEITLTLSGRVAEPVTFFVRTPPRFGTLGEIQRESRNSAKVIYTPTGGAGEDSFTFAAKSVDSPVSAAAKIRIGISEEPPALEFSRELDFGVTTVGEPVLKELQVRNVGGGVAFVKAGAQPPWTLVGETTYRIPAKKQVSIPITFTPGEPREFAGRLKLGNDPTDALVVRGRGLTPLDVEPLELALDPEARAEGTLQLTVSNLTMAERVVTLAWPEGIDAVRKIVVGPRGRQRIVARVPVSLGAVDGEVLVESRGYKTSIPLRIFPLPPRIQIVPEGALDFGKAKLGKRSALPLTVRNTGGSDVAIRLNVPPGVMVIPSDEAMTLKAGEEKRLEVSIEPAMRGEYSAELGILPSVGTPISVPLVAAVLSGQPAGAEVGGFLRLPEAQAPVVPDSGQPRGDSLVKNIAGTDRTSRSAEISWSAKVPGAARFRIDRRQISVGADGMPLTHWISWPEVKVRVDGDTAFALIEHLPPDSAWTVRIVPISSDGKEGIPSDPVRVTTLPGGGVPLVPVLGGIAFVALLAVVGALLRKRWSAIKSAQDERISKLANPNR